jgi:hypothetical protein
MRMIKSRRMKLIGHVARMGRKMPAGFCLEILKERGHKEHLNVCGRITLRWILEKQDAVVWTGLIWLRIGNSGGLL